ncbi:trichohyalin-like [Plakobranchus ocellatus]|uniref:Trichohyalin-like n=1 Tax=Plakobranchus ocellatus TaxID=259542 RepID=A0AAV3Z0Y5_9GAST|nr:trichohyalin-like [Plakobranchus ocellatus]
MSMFCDRSKDDQEKQLTLAEQRSTLRKKAVINGEKLRLPPEEKITPREDNLRDLQAVLVRALLRRHYQEREVMLSVLQDPSLEELVEAAAVMPPEQAVRRLKELSTKREALNLDDKADNEEQTYIFEEAGAIRAAGKVTSLSRELARTVLLAEACPHLLAELQDLQDMELAQLYLRLQDMSTTEVSGQIDVEVLARKNNYCNLVMKVFTKFDGESSQDFDKLVEQKYRRLLDLLVEECVCQQHGGKKAWDKLGHKQKVKAKSALLAKAVELWDSGNESSLPSWVDPKFRILQSFSYLVGADRKDYRESLANSGSGGTLVEGKSVKAEDSAGPETVSELHKRYKIEAGYLRDYLEGMLDDVPTDEDKQLLHNRLLWEITLLASAQDFSSASLIVGLAERQTIDMTGRLEHDRMRYQMLGGNLSTSKLDQLPHQSLKADKLEDIKDLQALFLKTLHHKHADEWRMMMALLSSERLRMLQEVVSVETELQRENRITQLHRQRDVTGLKEKSKQHAILEEALTVRKESVRQALVLGLSGDDQSESHVQISDGDVLTRLMAQLLQFQLVEAQVYLEAFAVEDVGDIRDNQAAILNEVSQGHVTNVASVAFTGLTSQTLRPTAGQGDDPDDVQIKQAVDGKYDALRDQLLIQALINQMGEAEWNRLSDLERQRLLMELKLRERRLRREGKYDEAAALLGKLQSDDENIRRLIEDTRAEHERKLRERLERRRARLAEGMSEEECDDLEAEEMAAEEEEERERKKNILLYLDQCSDQEKADLLRRLGELGDDHEKARQRHLELIRQRREERRLRQEGTLDTAAMLMGISQDQHNKSNLSKEEERNRQQELARQRLEMARQQRQLQGDNLVRGETIHLPGGIDGDKDQPGEGKVDDAVLSVLDKRHAKERDTLIKLLDDHSDGENRDEARVMTDDELRDKLEEQKELFNLWRESESRAPGDGEKILAESVALSVEWKRRDLEKDGQLASDEDVKVALLTQLQEVQEAEAGQTMLALIDVDEERASEILHNQKQRLSSPGHDNLATVLLEFSTEGEGQKGHGEDEDLDEGEKKVVQALEKKYDAMKDKLLMEALMREMGEAEWSRLSDLERQKKLVELKMREKRLRREGRMDEIAQLLGDFADDSDKLSQFLGQSAEDQKRRLQEKLELRKRLREEKEAKGETIDDETLDDLVEEEDKKMQRKNILANLDMQFEAEKAALLSGLKNQSDQKMREKKRQMELAKLQREQRKLKKEDKFDSAAMIFALGEQNLKAQQQSIMSERDRQRELARQRLEALKQKRAAKQKGESNESNESDGKAEEGLIPEEVTDESTMVQSSLLSGLEKLQMDEQATLLNLIARVDTAKNVKGFDSSSNYDLQENLSKLQAEYQAWEAKTAKFITAQTKLGKLPSYDKSKFQKEAEKRKGEQTSILEKALSNKLELERRRLVTLRPNLTAAQIKDELSVCALTFLQKKQQKFLITTQDSIKDATVEELKQSRHTQQLAHQSGVFPALTATCFHVCATSDLADMLHSKTGAQAEDETHDLEIMLADEYNTEREELLRRGERESINVDVALKRLEDQYEQRRQAMNSDLSRQRAELRERLASKRQAADDVAWGKAAMAGQIFGTGAANFDSAKQAKKTELSRQDTLLQQKLQERRAAKEAEKARKTAEDEARRIAELEKAEAADRVASPAVDRRFSSPMLTRERTALDVTVSEDEKQAKYDQLLEQQSFKHNQMIAQQARQEMMLKKRLENRSNKRENEVAALFSLGERQKTNLQEIKKGEQERQLAQVRERKTRLRESRSQSPTKRNLEAGPSK